MANIDLVLDAVRDVIKESLYSVTCDECSSSMDIMDTSVDDDYDICARVETCCSCGTSDDDNGGVDPYDVTLDLRCAACDETLTVINRSFDGDICGGVEPCKCTVGSLKIGG